MKATSAMLLGKWWRLTTTGHTFKVTARSATKLEVREHNTFRWVPTELLLAAHAAGLLVEVPPA